MWCGLAGIVLAGLLATPVWAATPAEGDSYVYFIHGLRTAVSLQVDDGPETTVCDGCPIVIPLVSGVHRFTLKVPGRPVETWSRTLSEADLTRSYDRRLWCVTAGVPILGADGTGPPLILVLSASDCAELLRRREALN